MSSNEDHDKPSNNSNGSSNHKTNGGSGAGELKPTFSQITMNSHLFNNLPKYIFQSEHAALKSVAKFKDQQKNDPLNHLNLGYEVSEYPIEMIESQQHALERHMSIRYV